MFKLNNVFFLSLLYILLFFSSLLALIALSEVAVNNKHLLFFIEDGGVIETLSFIFLASTSIFLFYALFFKNQFFIKKTAPTFLALLLMLAALERTSWGQAYLHFSSPGWFLNHNQDKALNVHDLVVNGVNWHLWIVRGMLVFTYGYLIILPLTASGFPVIKKKMSRFGLPIVPKSFSIPVFLSLIAAFIFSRQFPTVSFDPHKIPELVTSAALFFCVISEYNGKR